MSYRTSYRTELRSESSGRVMSKVLQAWARPTELGWAGGTAVDRDFHRIGAAHELGYPAIVAQGANGLS